MIRLIYLMRELSTGDPLTKIDIVLSLIFNTLIFNSLNLSIFLSFWCALLVSPKHLGILVLVLLTVIQPSVLNIMRF